MLLLLWLTLMWMCFEGCVNYDIFTIFMEISIAKFFLVLKSKYVFDIGKWGSYSLFHSFFLPSAPTTPTLGMSQMVSGCIHVLVQFGWRARFDEETSFGKSLCASVTRGQGRCLFLGNFSMGVGCALTGAHFSKAMMLPTLLLLYLFAFFFFFLFLQLESKSIFLFITVLP